MPADVYIFAGGGTGGHLYPGLAVAEALAAIRPGALIVFACSDRDIDRHILETTPYAFVPQPVRPLPRRPGEILTFVRTYAASARLARRLLVDLRPRAVLGLGGFAAGPVVCRAAKAAIPTALLNPDAIPGKANRLLARRVDVIFAQHEMSREHFPAACRAKLRAVGCPVRAAFAAARREEALEHFGLRPDRRTLLANGGSLGAASINEALGRLTDDLAALADRWQLLHVTGREKLPAAAPPGPMNVRRLEYCQRMDLAYAAADLALARAGASTTAELAETATPAVLMPYPHHADRHQWHNAAALAEAGAAVICDDAADPEENARSLRRALLPLLRDQAALAEMTRAAGRLGRRNAAAAVARWLADPQP